MRYEDVRIGDTVSVRSGKIMYVVISKGFTFKDMAWPVEIIAVVKEGCSTENWGILRSDRMEDWVIVRGAGGISNDEEEII
jgi:hypothetical protein